MKNMALLGFLTVNLLPIMNSFKSNQPSRSKADRVHNIKYICQVSDSVQYLVRVFHFLQFKQVAYWKKKLRERKTVPYSLRSLYVFLLLLRWWATWAGLIKQQIVAHGATEYHSKCLVLQGLLCGQYPKAHRDSNPEYFTRQLHRSFNYELCNFYSHDFFNTVFSTGYIIAITFEQICFERQSVLGKAWTMDLQNCKRCR